MTTRPAAYADFYDLYKSPDVAYAYGVVYGDDATETSEDMSVAYGHDSDYGNTSGHGMRAVIVYNKNDARHVMFPIGATYGHRATDGSLRYAGRSALMDNKLAPTRPVFYNIMYSKGAVYWLAMFAPDDDPAHPLLYNSSGNLSYATAWDMNYTSYDFYPYGNDATPGHVTRKGADGKTITEIVNGQKVNVLFNGTHGAYIRMVDK